MTRPVVVTGAAGFIGRHLVASLLADSCRVRAFLLPGEAPPTGAGTPPSIVRGDVTRPADVERAVLGAEGDSPARAIVHLAAVVGDWGPWSRFEAVTVRGTAHVLRAAARAGARVVLASSIVVYGQHLGRRPCDETTPHGRAAGPYSRAKQAQERLALDLADRLDVELAVVRPANVFGPGSGPWVETMIDLLDQRRPTLLGDGDVDAGLCHVDNLVALLRRAIDAPEAVGGVYNAADGFGIGWRRYVHDLAAAAGTPPPVALPRPLAQVIAPAGEVLFRLARQAHRPPITREALRLVTRPLDLPTERARRDLGWRPTVAYEPAMLALAADLASARRGGAAAASASV
ncbi:MAG: NAD-dependent epimerase/dehydratase family protein [Acidobacteriota bacterium]